MTDDDLYARVVEFVAKTLHVRGERIHATSRLADDFGVDGDDAVEFMTKFSETFSVDMSEFQFSRHFGPEGASNPIDLLVGIVRSACGMRTHDFVDIRIRDLVSAARQRNWRLDRPGTGEAGAELSQVSAPDQVELGRAKKST